MTKLIKFCQVAEGTWFRYNSQSFIKTPMTSAGSIVFNARTLDDSFGNHIIELISDYRMVKIEE